jgi:predicted CXXCH cytochrome family protein
MKKISKISGCISLILFLFTTQLFAETSFDNCSKKGCHLIQTKYSEVHEPVEDDCLNCHETKSKTHPNKGKKDFELAEKTPDLCYSCHDAFNSAKHIHEPVGEGDCLSCHNPHSTENEMLLTADGGEVCLECHDLAQEGHTMHGPVAANMCTACHNPHQAELKNLLAREDMELCTFCHTNKKDVQDSPSVHEPFLEGCVDCHSAHSSPYKYMVNKDVPGLCFDCHEKIEVQVGNKSEVHGPFQEGGKCYKCHNAHVSEQPNLLMEPEQNLCFSCHDKDLKKDGRKIKNIAKRVNKKKFIHEPINDKGCSACHAAHTPDNFFLLSAAYPKGSYGEGKAESFAHCFDCHDEALMKNEKTTKETQFRDGNSNLHYLHVSREKARNCTTCHDVHGSKYAHIIAEKVPFGKWDMPMKFKKNANGGSCLTGCHKELSYDRLAAVNKKE